MSKYKFTDDMGDILGYGGDVELQAQEAIIAGLKWLDKNPKKNPKAIQSRNIVGITKNNSHADQLLTVILKVTDPYGFSGAMDTACLQHCCWIHENGWDEYVKMRREQKAQRSRG